MLLTRKARAGTYYSNVRFYAIETAASDLERWVQEAHSEDPRPNVVMNCSRRRARHRLPGLQVS